ncbi:hypothetical protein RJ639_036246 [Escallonia herrerae]|uniref:Protease Do-like PDZ domain-containing protein n=1 Tax=Escallonia herrerae TaxID=1293975 RepID=A0AA88WSG0_9ASTE|nr:hypothetical protein RJ639_036246 [Escallonia herrerae]
MLACRSNLVSKPPLALKADSSNKTYLSSKFTDGKISRRPSVVSVPSPSKPCHRQLQLSLSQSSKRQSRLCSIKEELSSLAETLLYWSRNYEDGTVDEVDLQDFRWDNIRDKFFKTLCGFVVAEPPLDAVVKVTCFSANPDFTRPWQREQECASSSGFIVPGRRVLTCAHSVDHHTQVKLKRHGSDTTYTATVLAMAPESDIALLTVKDNAFWEGVKPVDFGDLPAPKDELIIAGYPMDREQLCAIRGTMSKARVVPYYHSGTKLLALQLNVVLKGGNSGGPVFSVKGKCVGIAFQASETSVGEIIPVPIIKHFLQDFDKNGADTGVPSFGINWQEMENPDLRASMKMRSDQQGVLVTEILPRYPESDMLKPYDVILSIDGVNIANDGTVPLSRGQRIDFSHLITRKFKGDKVQVKVLRDSEIREFTIKLSCRKQFMPANTKGRPLSYYIIGGFVFTTLSIPYLRSMLLKADINNGYDEMAVVCNQVLTLNGKPVKSLKNLAVTVENCEEGFLKFLLENGKTVVLEAKAAKAATPDILKAHCISSAMSDDLKT